MVLKSKFTGAAIMLRVFAAGGAVKLMGGGGGNEEQKSKKVSYYKKSTSQYAKFTFLHTRNFEVLDGISCLRALLKGTTLRRFQKPPLLVLVHALCFFASAKTNKLPFLVSCFQYDNLIQLIGNSCRL